MRRTPALWRTLLLTAAAITAWTRLAQVPNTPSHLSTSDESLLKPESSLHISGQLPGLISPSNWRDDWTGHDRPHGLPFRMNRAPRHRPPCGVTMGYLIVDHLVRRPRRSLARTEDWAVQDNLLEPGESK